jgi:hypothetical protein|tara:strand:- start:245 stop:562 length:318 start_codon:yes stop_codon:yes gene_type:complete
MKEVQPNGFRKLLSKMMDRRWLITAIVLITFFVLMLGILASIHTNSEISGGWKEILLLLLGAFIGSYGKIIDYWFSDTDKDKMLVQKMDEEDDAPSSKSKCIHQK